MRKLMLFICVICCCISTYAQTDYYELEKRLNDLSYSASWSRRRQIDGLKQKVGVIAVAKGMTKELADSVVSDFFDVKLEKGIDSLKIEAYKDACVTAGDFNHLISLYSTPEAKIAVGHLREMCGGEAFLISFGKKTKMDATDSLPKKNIHIEMKNNKVILPKNVSSEYKKKFTDLCECFGLNAVLDYKMRMVFIHIFISNLGNNLKDIYSGKTAEDVFLDNRENIELIISHEYLTEDDIDCLVDISKSDEALKINKAVKDYSTKINDYIVSSVVSFAKSFSISSDSASNVKDSIETEVAALPDIDVNVEKVYKLSEHNQIERMASFPGGNNGLLNYLYKSINPKIAHIRGVYGSVVCSFIIAKDGTIHNVEVKESLDPLLDKEAIRVIRSMPEWTPAKTGGENVNVWYRLPVTFGKN